MKSQPKTFSVIFHLRKAGTEEEKLPIYARVTIDGRRMEQSVKQKIKPEDWNDRRGMAKPKSEEFKVLNRYLEQVRSALVECYREMSLAKKVITIDSFKSAYMGEDENEFTLCKLANYHNQDMKDSICWGTLKNYFTTQKYLQRYLKERLHIPISV
jgi:hypothetical protein